MHMRQTSKSIFKQMVDPTIIFIPSKEFTTFDPKIAFTLFMYAVLYLSVDPK